VKLSDRAYSQQILRAKIYAETVGETLYLFI